MKIKVSEASGRVLDWMVAIAEGKRPSLFILERTGALAKEHNYSTDWNQGGPIIEREEIYLHPTGNADKWASYIFSDEDEERLEGEYGTTALIAAMRCYVASKLGDEVEVPDELAKD